jgi:hypothetical protein
MAASQGIGPTSSCRHSTYGKYMLQVPIIKDQDVATQLAVMRESRGSRKHPEYFGI